MPIINVKITRGRTEKQKQELASAITGDVVRILDVEPEWVTVLIDEYERENWSTGGELHSLKYGPGHGKQGVNK
jgi:4-oxalocrotonate tautomerase